MFRSPQHYASLHRIDVGSLHSQLHRTKTAVAGAGGGQLSLIPSFPLFFHIILSHRAVRCVHYESILYDAEQISQQMSPVSCLFPVVRDFLNLLGEQCDPQRRKHKSSRL